MPKLMHQWVYLLILTCTVTTNTFSQKIWTKSKANKTGWTSLNQELLPTNDFQLFELDSVVLKASFPSLGTSEILIPLPDGKMATFAIRPNKIMHPDLADATPFVQTFKGTNLDQPGSNAHFVWSTLGFHVMGYTSEGTFFINHIRKDDDYAYAVFWAADMPDEPFICETNEPTHQIADPFEHVFKPAHKHKVHPSLKSMAASPHAIGTNLKTYRLAISMTAERTNSLGGFAAGVSRVAEITSDMNLMLNRDISAQFELIASNNSYVFTDPATDPFTTSWLGENISFMNSTIGSANFDVGHNIKQTGGGVAYVGVMCNNTYKAGGTSSNTLKVIAHEFGHQMAAGHTFNDCGQYGGGDFEPGSGNTIMSYRGLCGSSNMPGGDVLHYQASSFIEMVNHMHLGGGGNCATNTATSNQVPVISVPPSGFTIPISTPFKLVGSATDDGPLANLTYFWDEFDSSPVQTTPQNPSGDAPIFRSLNYSADSFRYFPDLATIVTQNFNIGEVLPTYDRDLDFKFMVKDNQVGHGAVDYGELEFFVDDDAGPFLVQSPNTNNILWSAGQTRTVTWDVANTDVAPVNCSNVHILISYDGGYTYPDTLVQNTPNDGSETITVPSTVGTQNRIMVAAADNVFFDISDQDFEIVAATVNDFNMIIDPISRSVCSENSVNYQIDIYALGVFSSNIDLSLTGLPAGVTSNLPGQVGPTSSTTLTLGNINSLSPGKYTITFTATESGGGVNKSVDLYLVVKGTGDAVPGNSVTFNNNNYISVPQTTSHYPLTESVPFSVEFWMKTTSTSNDDAMVAQKNWDNGNNAGWVFAMVSNGEVRFNVGDGNSRVDLGVDTQYNDGEWHHIAGTFDPSGAGTLRLYIDGVLIEENSYVNASQLAPTLDIGIGADSHGDWEFDGSIDELRIWNKVLTLSEIRERMHLSIGTCSADLISYWQFNEGSGDALDKVGFQNGTLNNSPTRNTDSCPMGPGTSNTQVESNGLISFTNTNLSANYSTQTGANTTTSKLNIAPFNTASISGSEILFDDQYWILNRFDNLGAFQSEVTLGFSEDITAADESTPFNLHLYRRDFNSDDAWTLVSQANSANDANNTATFPNLMEKGQLFVTRSTNQVIAVFESILNLCHSSPTQAGPSISYEVAGSNLTSDLIIDAPANFEISLDSLNNFTNQLTLSPSGGAIAITKIFVRLSASPIGNYSGAIQHTSTNAATKTINVSGESLADTEDIAGGAASFTGNNEYISINSLTWQPTAFTIEFWLKPFSFSQWNQNIGADWGEFRFHAAPDGSVYAGISTAANSRIHTAANTLELNIWNHCALTFDNGEIRFYHNGNLVGTASGSVMPSQWSGFQIGQQGDDALDGHLDEFRIWNDARTQEEIRKNMHLPINLDEACIEGLTLYYQFKDNGDGSVTDALGNHNSSLAGDGGASIISSNVPVAEGFSANQTVNLEQSYSFNNGLEDAHVDGSFSAPLPNGEVVAFRIIGEGSHGSDPSNESILNPYWIFNNYGDSTTVANLIFEVGDDIMPADEANPQHFHLYQRSSNSYGNWSLVAGASSVSAANNTLTFNSIKTHGQLLIVKNTSASLTINQSLNDFGLRAVNVSSKSQKYTLSGASLSGNVSITAPAGFEISLDSLTGYNNNIDLIPQSGILTETCLYVRFHPTVEQVYTGNISHLNNGLGTQNIAVTGTGKHIVTVAGSAIEMADPDYLTLPRSDELVFGPNQDFTVEFWIYTDANNSDPSIIGNKDWDSGNNIGWVLAYLADDWKMNFRANGSSRVDVTSNGPDINDGKWHHLAASFDRDGQCTLYQDGWIVGQVSIAVGNGQSIDAGFPIRIFQDGPGDYSDQMKGKIDELRIWTDVRSTKEIRENMHLTLIGNEDELAAYYQIYNANGEVIDLINGNNAVLGGNPNRVTSYIPAAAGVSATQDVQAIQSYSFHEGMVDTDLDIAFDGTLPLGEVVVSKLTGEDPHGDPPTSNTLSDPYWIVNNFGTNTNGLDADLTFQMPANWVEFNDVNAYQLHKRPSRSLPSGGWQLTNAASTVDINNDLVTYNDMSSFSQIIISKNLPATCSNGQMDGDETGVDCGGSCAPCDDCVYTSIDFNDFESGLGIWVDGGDNCQINNNASYATSGNYTIRLRDDTESSVATTNNLDLSTYEEIKISFNYYPRSMDDPNEDFWLQISTDGGANFTTIEEWNQGDEFENDIFYSVSVQYQGNFTANTQIRFRCDASGSQDWVYLDDIQISACAFTCGDGIQNGNEIGVDCGGDECPDCPTCNDGVQNGSETGVDCGGPDCPTCPTCNDGIQNGNETGVDCGGPDCTPCITCSDGIQNGDEVGVDCGGSCPDCSPSCLPSQILSGSISSGTELKSVKDTIISTVAISGSAAVEYRVEKNIILQAGFSVANGATFKGTFHTCTTTCFDGVQNGDETGVDCGGSSCPACPTCDDGIQNGNETGVDCGGDCTACTAPCLVNQVLSGSVSSGNFMYNVSDTLTSTEMISGTANVEYVAGKSIILKPGFWVSAGATFHAYIMSCTPLAMGNDHFENEPTYEGLESIEAFDSLGLQIETLQPQIKAFPNPTSGQLHLRIAMQEEDKVHLGILNALGSEIMRLPELGRGNYFEVEVDVSMLPDGIYWVKVWFAERGEFEVVGFVKS